jgi:hypothetical protein
MDDRAKGLRGPIVDAILITHWKPGATSAIRTQ